MQPWKIEREESEGIPPVVPYLNYYIAIIIIITLVMWKKAQSPESDRTWPADRSNDTHFYFESFFLLRF